MSNTVLIWSLGALLLFWGVGAYNRLVRLRALAVTAFAPLQLHYAQYTTLVQSNFGVRLGEEPSTTQMSLLSAAQQFEISLKAASTQPLGSLRMSALNTAHEVLFVSWARVRGEPQDLAGELVPENLQKQWAGITVHAEHGRDEFNRRIQDYNHGIEQFPASFLAWLFRFKPAHQKQ